MTNYNVVLWVDNEVVERIYEAISGQAAYDAATKDGFVMDVQHPETGSEILDTWQ